MYTDRDFDYLDSGDDSEDGRAESSEDDLDMLLNASPEQRRQIHSQRNNPEKELVDDFEQEMNAALQQTVAALEAERQHLREEVEHQPSTSKRQSSESGEASQAKSAKFYDSIYFDSDEDDNEENKQDGISSDKHPVLSNDDLFYDPKMDDEDEKWVTQQRKQCLPKANGSEGNSAKRTALTKSDAVLNCPACMTTLCRDCQRHAIYDNQYRAMFVTNCDVDTTELLKFPEQKSKKKKKKKQNTEDDISDSDKYHPVKCSECETVVAMRDMDELYHFFNVLTSYS